MRFTSALVALLAGATVVSAQTTIVYPSTSGLPNITRTALGGAQTTFETPLQTGVSATETQLNATRTPSSTMGLSETTDTEAMASTSASMSSAMSATLISSAAPAATSTAGAAAKGENAFGMPFVFGWSLAVAGGLCLETM